MSTVRLFGATSGYVDLAAPAVADDATLTLPTAASGFGKVLQVVQTVKTDTFTTASDTYVTVTDMTVTITPSSSANKILVVASLAVGGTSQGGAQQGGSWRITGGNAGTFVGDAASSRLQGIFGGAINANLSQFLLPGAIIYLDSPATTSATTYTLETRRAQAAGTVTLNRSGFDGDTVDNVRGASSITAIEVAA